MEDTTNNLILKSKTTASRSYRFMFARLNDQGHPYQPLFFKRLKDVDAYAEQHGIAVYIRGKRIGR